MKKEEYMSSLSLRLYNLCQRYPFLRYLKALLYFTDAVLLLFIPKPKDKTSRKKKEILIIYNYAFGDGMIWLCAARGLREIYSSQNYNITLICQKGLQSIYENASIFDEVIPYDLTKATFNPKVRFNLYKLLRKKKYDIFLDPIGAGECTTNVFVGRAVVASEKITILDTTLDKILCPKWMREKIYTKIIEVKKKNLSLLEFYSEFIRGLGNKNFKVELLKTQVTNFNLKLPKEYYIVFPSASTMLKRWPITSYAEIIKRIYSKTKLPILFCGTDSDVESISKLKELIGDIPQYDYVNKTSLLEFIEVIKRAKFVVTNDTSTYHIAVVNEVPVAIITGGYTYDRYVEYQFKGCQKYKKPYIIVHKMDCFNCDNNCNKLKSSSNMWPCLEKITVDDAWQKIEEMIDREL